MPYKDPKKRKEAQRLSQIKRRAKLKELGIKESSSAERTRAYRKRIKELQAIKPRI